MFTLSWYEEFIAQLAVGLLTVLASKAGTTAVTLSWWEQFIVEAASSLLSLLSTKIKNTAEQGAIQAAAAFLQQLLSGAPLEASGIQAAIAFLQKLLAGQVSIT